MARPAKDGRAAPIRFDRLTEVEYRILKLLDLGFSNKQLAERMGITAGTATRHLHQLFDKLQVAGRGEALALARALRLV